LNMKTADAQALARGRRVAAQLGWPRHYQGFFGATAGLLDPFAGFKRPNPSINLVQEYALRRQLATVRKMTESAEQISRISRY
jgi:hypothetical protein